MNKPTKPNITIPESFAVNGVKADFDNNKILNGFDRIQPDVLAGDNLNKFIDDTYKGLNYGMAATDALNLINEGETLIVKNGEFTSGAISGMPIGTIYSLSCTNDYVPEGSLSCDGTEYYASQFDDFFKNYLGIAGTPLLNTCTYAEYEQELATYGQCAKFAVDTANATFRVPKIKNGAVIQQALSDGELGKSYNAGLPNITGSFGNDGTAEKGCISGNLFDGAFYSSNIKSSKSFGSGTSSTTTPVDVSFDASKSNPIYGNSGTVQMNAVALRYFVVVANGSINQSMMDWSAWASSLQGKADKTAVDGQFIPKQLHVMTGANAISGTEYDLSTYLPDDSHTYLVKFLLKGYDDDGEYFYYINTDVWNYNKTSTASAADCYLYGGIHSRQNVVSIDLPVGAGRCMQVVGSGADALNIFCIGYRRLGTNS